ncbi:MAG: GH3 auxin-responsive promoter family protein, partial [Blastochloris sp.]|nr:GH3 auxin-responsive promoter family protein [Blastochloris sp.]
MVAARACAGGDGGAAAGAPDWRYANVSLYHAAVSAAQRSLALISVWNPTFLVLLLEPLPAWWPQLAADIAAGTLTPPAALAAPLAAAFARANRPDARRAGEIAEAFGAGGTAGAVYSRLWPRLRLISCWADGHAAAGCPRSRACFPQRISSPRGCLPRKAVFRCRWPGKLACHWRCV